MTKPPIVIWFGVIRVLQRSEMIAGFDRSVNVSGQVECSILRGIENDPLSQATVLLRWRGKTKWPHVATHADDVIILLRRVDDIDLAVVDLLLELFEERRSRRKRR